jgi:hypothetical protein
VHRQNGRGPPLHWAGNDPRIVEQPARTLANANGFNDCGAPSQDAPASAVDLADASPISPIALAAGREVLFGATMDMCDWAASHACSAGEAAWRGDREALGAHLQAARNAVEAALLIFGALEDAKAKAADDELAPA